MIKFKYHHFETPSGISGNKHWSSTAIRASKRQTSRLYKCHQGRLYYRLWSLKSNPYLISPLDHLPILRNYRGRETCYITTQGCNRQNPDYEKLKGKHHGFFKTQITNEGTVKRQKERERKTKATNVHYLNSVSNTIKKKLWHRGDN